MSRGLDKHSVASTVLDTGALTTTATPYGYVQGMTIDGDTRVQIVGWYIGLANNDTLPGQVYADVSRAYIDDEGVATPVGSPIQAAVNTIVNETAGYILLLAFDDQPTECGMYVLRLLVSDGAADEIEPYDITPIVLQA